MIKYQSFESHFQVQFIMKGKPKEYVARGVSKCGIPPRRRGVFEPSK
jgi:hypothetical protein